MIEKRVLVIGGNGLLGTTFRHVVGDKYTYTVRKFSDEKFNSDIAIGNIEDLSIENDAELFQGFDVVINCAAVTAVDNIESDYSIHEKAIKANYYGVEKLAAICKYVGATLIHISSDYVFDGTLGREYYPSDKTYPINSYGSLKVAGENAVINSGCKYIIIRTSWVYSEYAKSFVTSFFDKLYNESEFKGVNDIISSPTYAVDLAKAIEKIIDDNMLNNIGIYHFTNEGCCTKYDIMCYVATLMKNFDGVITPVSNTEFNLPAKRPYCSVLSKQSFKTTFNIPIRGWMSAMKECVENYIEFKQEN